MSNRRTELKIGPISIDLVGMDGVTKDAMLAASEKLREFAAMDQLRLAMLHAEKADTERRLREHQRECTDLARALYVAAKSGEIPAERRLLSAAGSGIKRLRAEPFD